jgi:phosphoribosylanthranilate isomerase
MRVKICGITTLEDALAACEAGADAIGFVFYPKSSRYISASAARRITSVLPPFIKKIGVFVNEKCEIIDNICREAKLDMAQIHFEMDEACEAKLQTAMLRVVRAKEREDVMKHAGEYRLIDAFVDGYGGEGKRLDLGWFDGADVEHIILAGGLDAAMLDEVKRRGFYGVDVSSALEASAGRKDPIKMREFVKAAKCR